MSANILMPARALHPVALTHPSPNQEQIDHVGAVTLDPVTTASGAVDYDQ